MTENLKVYNLSTNSIAEACDYVADFYSENNAQKREAIRIRFLIEETLLNYRDQFGEDVKFELRKSKKPLKLSVQIVVYCDKFNPFKTEEDGVMGSLMAASSIQNPSWQYVKSNFEWLFTSAGRNEIIFSVPRETKTSGPAKIAIGIGLGVGAGALCRLILGAEASLTFANNYIIPLANLYTGMLSVMGILLLFFTLPLCIVQYRNVSEFQSAAKNTVGSYIIGMIGISFLTAAIGGVCFTIDASSTTDASIFKSIFDVFISFFPSSLIVPFINFDCMQIMIIGMLFGFAFLAMGDKNKLLVDIFDRFNLAAVLTNSFFAKYVSVYVCFMMFGIVLSSSLDEMSKWLGFALIIILACIVSMFVATLLVCVKFKLDPIKFFKRFTQSFIINMSSASVSASFMSLFGELTNACGVEGNFTGLACNVGTILYKPMYSVFLGAAAMVAANMSGALSAKMMVQIIFLAIVLPATIPNIPGGAASVIVVFLGQLGVGNNFAEIFVSLNAVLQYIIVPANIYIMQCLIVRCAHKEDKLDMNIMLKE